MTNIKYYKPFGKVHEAIYPVRGVHKIAFNDLAGEHELFHGELLNDKVAFLLTDLTHNMRFVQQGDEYGHGGLSMNDLANLVK